MFTVVYSNVDLQIASEAALNFTSVKFKRASTIVHIMKLEPLDIRILELLEEDSRQSYREIAKKANTTTPTVSSKVETFKNIGLIRGFTTSISAEHLNEITILLHIDCKPSDMKIILDVLNERQDVRELFVVDGSQIHAKITVLDHASLNGFLEELGRLEEIRSYNYKTITRTMKENCRAVLFDGLNVTIGCFYCKKPMADAPVKLKMDGKDHYLCCNSCEKLYKEKYNKLKEGY